MPTKVFTLIRDIENSCASNPAHIGILLPNANEKGPQALHTYEESTTSKDAKASEVVWRMGRSTDFFE
jgi:hypothetical protein